MRVIWEYKKRIFGIMAEFCTACPRHCGADRETSAGFCGVKNKIMISRAALHFWEEPCLSGTEEDRNGASQENRRGSGTVFFSGCNLRCVYCQNRKISRGEAGRYITKDELAAEMLRLRNIGAYNINLVTPSHYYLQIAEVLKTVRPVLGIPVVSNTSSYDSVEIFRQMDGLIDIYLADYKYDSSELARKYSAAADYPEVARNAIAEMVRQTGTPEFDENGMLKKGVIVRILLLPGHVHEACACVDRIYNTYGDNVILSLMSQYTPVDIPAEYPELNRRVTKREYERLVDHALEIGVENAFIQEGDVAKESFIPEF